MRSIKQIVSQVDRLISQLEPAKDDCILRNCRLYVKREAPFAIAIAGNGKKFVVNTDGRYNGFRGFQGCLLDKYNVAVYTLTDYMVTMRLLTLRESEAFCEYAAESRRKADEVSKLRQATDLLRSNGYQVSRK